MQMFGINDRIAFFSGKIQFLKSEIIGKTVLEILQGKLCIILAIEPYNRFLGRPGLHTGKGKSNGNEQQEAQHTQ